MMYNTNSQFKIPMSKSNLYDYGHAYSLVKGTIKFTNTETAAASIMTIKKKYLKLMLRLLIT